MLAHKNIKGNKMAELEAKKNHQLHNLTTKIQDKNNIKKKTKSKKVVKES